MNLNMKDVRPWDEKEIKSYLARFEQEFMRHWEIKFYLESKQDWAERAKAWPLDEMGTSSKKKENIQDNMSSRVVA